MSRDNNLIVSGSYDGTLKIWDVKTGKCVSTLDEHQDAVRSVALNPDANLALSGSFDCSLKLWDISTNKCLRTFIGHTGEIHSVCFSSDGKFALSGAFDRTLKYWDINSGKCLRTFEDDADVYSVCLSQDNRFAISGNGDATLKVWDIHTGECLKVFEEHTDVVSSVDLTQDNRYAVSVSGDETIKLWKLDLPDIKQPASEEVVIHNSIHKPNTNYWKLGGLILLPLIILSFGFMLWISSNSRKDTDDITPPKTKEQICDRAIANAQAGIQNYQSIKNNNENISSKAISTLKRTLDEIETQYQNNEQPVCLEEYLGRVRHKYAVEVLASSGQQQEAIDLLQKVPDSYSQIKAVKQKLQEWDE